MASSSSYVHAEVPGSAAPPPLSPPPLPPPKPGSHEVSGISTPTAATTGPSISNEPVAAAAVAATISGGGGGDGRTQQISSTVAPPRGDVTDPGDGWLPALLQSKSKQDIADILASPALLQALTHAPQAAHPSLTASHLAVQTALAENIELATRLSDLETRLSHQRTATQAQLIASHALERQWRAKQSAMDHALAPFAPASLYQRLGQAVNEQAAFCQALEESFLEGEGDGGGEFTTEREVAEWVKRYREARVLYYLRRERKERWAEGRVGGWR